MYKLFFILIFSILLVPFVSADYETELINNFINSPSYDEIAEFKDPLLQFCEYSYLDAYRRRDYSELELLFCKEIFLQKSEGELLYKKKVLGERGIY